MQCNCGGVKINLAETDIINVNVVILLKFKLTNFMCIDRTDREQPFHSFVSCSHERNVGFTISLCSIYSLDGTNESFNGCSSQLRVVDNNPNPIENISQQFDSVKMDF